MPQPLYSLRKNPGTHWIGGWADPISGTDVVAKRKILLGIEPRSSSP
jgi:hypothetical protein